LGQQLRRGIGQIDTVPLGGQRRGMPAGSASGIQHNG
jgi:hypothetical protein